VAASSREHSLALLGRLLVTLRLPESVPIRLTATERAYLIRACERALSGHHDPLAIDRGPGGQHDGARLMLEAQQVHRLVRAGATIRAACQQVGDATGRDGGKSQAVEKNYKAHRRALEAADRFYAARNAGGTPDPADIAAILAGKAKGK
jgi:hypothetical protein